MLAVRRAVAFAMSGVLFLTAGAPALAQTVRDLNDLVGARAGQAEGELERRGYESVRTQEGGATKWTYWRRGDECVQVTTRDGRYQRIDRAERRECEHRDSGNSATAVAAGVVILGLAAALASHNRHHDDADRNHDDEYSRGYQAGLYGSDYDARHETEGYHQGYLAGEAERGNRRTANSHWVRGAPTAAQEACSRRADEFQDRPYGSSVPVGVRDLGGGTYELIMATGQYRSRCVVTASGDVQAMNPY